MTVAALVEDLKAAHEDFEFYPTTPEMIRCMIRHLERGYEMRRSIETFLDVGAGHGAVLKAVHEQWPSTDCLAVERSHILIAELVKFAKVIGTDFHEQTFIPKQVDVLFCNPPYSEYEAWTSRLIRECPAKHLYFIIPQRWKDNTTIGDAICFREAEVKVIGSFDFLDAERSARAKVDILHVEPKDERDDLFDRFFLERFQHLQQNADDADKRKEAQRTRRTEEKHSLVKRDGLIGAMVALYDRDLKNLQENYDKIASMDMDLLGTLEVSVKAIIGTLKTKIDNLKDQYWTEMFQRLDSVTKRLTSKNRRTITERIGGFKAVDFTSKNIYAVVLWVIENANQYVDSQILAVFDDMLGSANIHNYKSNKRVFGEGDWRYNNKPENITHVSLDYRIVIESGYRGIRKTFSYRRNQKEYYLCEGASNFLSDLLTVATILGFDTACDDPRLLEREHGESHYWSPGKSHTFKTTSGEDLIEAKAFLNGNMHIRMSQDLALALNVAVGKLRGWLRDHHQATSEFGEKAAEIYAKDLRVTPKQLLLSMSPTPDQETA